MYKKLDNLKCDFKLDFSENKATIKGGGDCYCTQFADEKTETQRSKFSKVTQLVKCQGWESNSFVITIIENLLVLFSFFSLSKLCSI